MAITVWFSSFIAVSFHLWPLQLSEINRLYFLFCPFSSHVLFKHTRFTLQCRQWESVGFRPDHIPCATDATRPSCSLFTHSCIIWQWSVYSHHRSLYFRNHWKEYLLPGVSPAFVTFSRSVILMIIWFSNSQFLNLISYLNLVALCNSNYPSKIGYVHH